MARRIILFTWPIILVTSFICNTLQVIVMIQLCRKRTPTYLTLVMTAIADTLVLIFSAGNAWILELRPDVDLVDILITKSDMTCKCYNFLFGVVSHLSMWLVAMGLVDASILIHRVRVYKRKVLKRIKTSFLVIITLILLMNSHCFWTFHRQAIKTSEGNISGYTCGFNDQNNGHMYSTEYRDFIWPVCNIAMTFILPFVLISVSIWRFYKKKVTDTAKHDGDAERFINPKMLVNVHVKDIKRMFLAVGVFCFIMNLPEFFNTFMFSFVFPHVKRRFKDNKHPELISLLCETFTHMGRAMKFLLCLMTSMHCRDELFSLGSTKPSTASSKPHTIDQKYKVVNTRI